MSYDEIGDVSQNLIEELRDILKDAKWKQVKSEERDYQTYFPDQVPDEFKDSEKAFFLKIPPGGKVHRHTDTDQNTLHIPIQTNPDSICYMADEPYYLEIGKVYSVNRQIEHHSVNNGTTDRIHFIVVGKN